jgi:MFS superfamily sulfate permease-like transporter
MTERSVAGEVLPGPVSRWRGLFPPAQWLPAYQAPWLPRDLIAGVTLAAYAVPVSMAYAGFCHKFCVEVQLTLSVQ